MNELIKKRIGRLVRLTTNDTTQIKSKLKYVKSIERITELGYANGYYNFRVDYTFYSPISYNDLVNKLVRERYTDSEEFAILRKAITTPTDEYYIYNAYVEDCKVRAKAFIEERKQALGE